MILISAGHYPEARGACYKGNCEHEEAMRWAEQLVAEIEPHAPCMLVPTGTLPEKVHFINTHNPILALEIHFNASENAKAKGFETLYYPGSEKGEALAILTNDALAMCFANNRGVKEGWYRQDRPGYKDYDGDIDGDETPLYFLQKTKCPAVIIEPEFIHNLNVIQNNRDHAVEVLADTLLAYYEDL